MHHYLGVGVLNETIIIMCDDTMLCVCLCVCECVCASQGGGADFSARDTQDFWRPVQSPTKLVSDHSHPHGSAAEADAGAAPRGHPTVGLPRKTDPQRGQGAEDGGAVELREAELMDDWTDSQDASKSDIVECATSPAELLKASW